MRYLTALLLLSVAACVPADYPPDYGSYPTTYPQTQPYISATAPTYLPSYNPPMPVNPPPQPYAATDAPSGYPPSYPPDYPPTYPPGYPTIAPGPPSQPEAQATPLPYAAPPASGQPRGPPNYGPYGSGYPAATTSAAIAGPMLHAHNAVRAPLSLPPLMWSTQLAATAQAWAAHLIATSAFAHRPNDPYGENLYAITGGTASPQDVMSAWVGEARLYDPRTNTCSGMCGHYTQIVWRATRYVGCAVASDGRRQVWVCNYDPPGNVIGYRPY